MGARGAGLIARVLIAALAVPAGAADAPVISLQLFQFRPAVLDVAAGTRVTWTNRDDIAHTVTAGTPERSAGGFDHRLAGPGATASVEFTAPGIYPYFCDRHHHMRGEVRVR